MFTVLADFRSLPDDEQMLNDKPTAPLPTTTGPARRRLFCDGWRPEDRDVSPEAAAEEIQRTAYAQKREQWSFDFLDGVPVEEGPWRWDTMTGNSWFTEKQNS